METRHMDSKAVKVKNLLIGGGYPVSVQTMWKHPLKTADEATIAAIRFLFDSGCEILRFAVPDMQSAQIFGEICSRLDYPFVADIHFDYKIALRCMDFPAAKIRINPGNIGSSWKVEEILKKAIDKQIPIRIGINSGSLPKSLAGHADEAVAMVTAAEDELAIFDKYNFKDVLVSLKSSDMDSTIQANRLFRQKYDYPLHLGITEAGPLIHGIVKTSIAFYTLLKDGIGDTIRVSLSDSSLNEIITGKQILNAVQKESRGVNIISCPTCGRTGFNVTGFLEKIQTVVNQSKKNITIAVMGCPVNGPGEARHADLGITGSGSYAVIFKKGNIIHKIKEEEALEIFLAEFEKIQ